MRWSIIRLIWLRELRDQLRDRRTLFMIAVLPLLLYPTLGVPFAQFLGGLGDRPSLVGVVGAEHLPASSPNEAGPAAAMVAFAAPNPFAGVRPDVGVGLVLLSRLGPHDFPPLLVQGQFN